MSWANHKPVIEALIADFAQKLEDQLCTPDTEIEASRERLKKLAARPDSPGREAFEDEMIDLDKCAEQTRTAHQTMVGIEVLRALDRVGVDLRDILARTAP